MLATPISMYSRDGGEEAITIFNKLVGVFWFYKFDEDHVVDPPSFPNGAGCGHSLFMGGASYTPAGE